MRRGNRFDEIPAGIHSHKSESLFPTGPPDAAIEKELREGGIFRERAISGRIILTAVTRAVEPSGFAHYGEVKRPRAGSVKGGHLKPDEL